MTDTEFLQILSLVTPVAILAVVLVMLRLFIWQDDRETPSPRSRAQGPLGGR